MLESRKWQGLWEKKKIQAVGRGAERGCTVEGEEKKNQKGLFGLILAGRRRMMSSGLGEPKPWGGAAPLLEIGLALGLGFFFLYFSDVSKLPPLKKSV
jgi:hypothetical protein